MAIYKCVKDVDLGKRGCEDCNQGRGCGVILADREQPPPCNCIYDSNRRVEFEQVRRRKA